MTRIHDYRAPTRGWGHDYHLNPDPDPNTTRIGGWGTGLTAGDYLLLSHPDGGEAFYAITDLEYTSNVLDQWFGRAVFLPGSSEVGRELAAKVQGEKTNGALLQGWWEV